MKIFIGFTLMIMLLSACSDNQNMKEIKKFITKEKNKVKKEIEGIPEGQKYRTFVYSASDLRSPFNLPQSSIDKQQTASNIQPDLFRIKQYLEEFDIASFAMVGYMANEKGIWGLVNNNSKVYRVKKGDYIGRNHGKITHIDEQEIQLVELMSTGKKHWSERQRRIPMQQKNKSIN